MSKFDSHFPIAQVPLARALIDMNVVTSTRLKKSSADRLSASIDLARAMNIANALQSSRLSVDAVTGDDVWLRQTCQEHYTAMRLGITQSFTNSHAPSSIEGRNVQGFRLPRVDEQLLVSSDGFSVYERFYTLHQSEMERRIKHLHDLLLGYAIGHLPTGTRLAVVDKALEPAMSRFARRSFTKIPRLLQRRFEILRETQRERDRGQDTPESVEQWLEPSGWLHQFHDACRQLLLAELDLRLQLARGLLETLDPSANVLDILALGAQADCIKDNL